MSVGPTKNFLRAGKASEESRSQAEMTTALVGEISEFRSEKSSLTQKNARSAFIASFFI